MTTYTIEKTEISTLNDYLNDYKDAIQRFKWTISIVRDFNFDSKTVERLNEVEQEINAARLANRSILSKTTRLLNDPQRYAYKEYAERLEKLIEALDEIEALISKYDDILNERA